MVIQIDLLLDLKWVCVGWLRIHEYARDPEKDKLFQARPPIWQSKNVNFTPSANSSVACKGSERVVGKDGDLSIA